MEAIKLPQLVSRTKSRGDARFERCEKRIRIALCAGLTQRRMNFQVDEICHLARISRTTFYAHHQSCDEALKKYEADLKQSFDKRMVYDRAGKDLIFTILLGFIRDERRYFTATILNADYWLLNEIFDSLKPILSETNANGIEYEFYIQVQLGIIRCWVKYESCSMQAIPGYIKKMLAASISQKSNS